MNELRFNLTPAEITANFDEVRSGLENMMQAYAGLEVTEENIPERKKDVATLRKIRKAVDDKRKEVKRDYEKPLKAFEGKCKELTGLIDKEIEHINTGLEAFEAARAAEKRVKITKLYEEHIGGYAEFLPMAKIYDGKWENKSCSDKEIIADLQQYRLNVSNDLQALKNASGEYYDDCLKAYKQNGNLAAAMQRLTDLRTAKERAESILREELKSAEEVRKSSTKTAENVENEREKWTFTVFSEEDAKSLRAYLEMFGIEYKEE